MSRLELGLFLPNTSGGTVIGSVPAPANRPHFSTIAAITQAAEAADFDFVLSQVKWRGFGGATGHWDYSLESFTLTAALAAVTKRIRLFASVGVRAAHPVVTAKMAATIDDIAPGRFGVNIVAGWNRFEYEQMGLWPEGGIHIDRYAYAEEFYLVMSQLWATGRADFDGRFFHVDDCAGLPMPKGGRLPVVCAGQSPEAIAFTARHGDFAFVGRMKDDAAALGELAGRITAAAEAEGRQVGSHVLVTIVQGSDDADALRRRDALVAQVDHAAINGWMAASGQDPGRVGYDTLPLMQRTFMGMHLIVGGPETIAARLDAFADLGLQGACLVFPDFAPDLDQFIADVLPLMRTRAPAALPVESHP